MIIERVDMSLCKSSSTLVEAKLKLNASSNTQYAYPLNIKVVQVSNLLETR